MSYFIYPYYKLRQGNQGLPEALLKKFTELGGSLHLQKQLYRLQLREYNGEQLIALTVGASGVPIESVVYARYVVLALPQRALKLLDPDSFIFQNPQFRADINTVTASPASKLFLSYDRAWWRELEPKIEQGQSTSDLPIRGCYYIGAEQDGKSLLLASLNDDVVTQFWDGYLQTSRYGPYSAPYRGLHDGLMRQSLLAPPEMVVEAQRQLKEIHNFDIPDPEAAIYHDWMQDPFGGGWHNWNPHARSWEVIPRIRQPIPGINVFLCGEAYSAQQGWIEGAINTAEMVLETYFGLPRPDWVLPEYDFGP
jgi:monoamine oxidase